MTKHRESGGVVLKRQITLYQAISICVGYMIGSGIFVSPYGVLKEVRSVGMALVLWGCSGVFNMMGALCYAELGATMPRSGGEYTYILRGFGRLPAFLALWMTFVLNLSVMTAASCLIFATYMLQPFFHGCDVPQDAVKLVAASTLRKYTWWRQCPLVPWWRHDFRTLSVSLLLGTVVSGGPPSQRTNKVELDVFFDASPDPLLDNQPNGWPVIWSVMTRMWSNCNVILSAVLSMCYQRIYRTLALSHRHDLCTPVIGPCLATATWPCRKNFSQWGRNLFWKLRCHWLKGLPQR